MAIDKLVDSTQLNADLTSVANAIRTKGGTSASLAFPADFVSAIAAIPAGGGFKYKTGDFTLASDTIQSVSPSGGIAHGLGVTPACVIIWQTTYTDDNIPTSQVNAGYVFLNRIMDIAQRCSSTASSANSFYASFTIGANTTVGCSMNGGVSASYMLGSLSFPTSEKFFLNKTGSSNYWRTGVSYHYFVSEAWWT